MAKKASTTKAAKPAEEVVEAPIEEIVAAEPEVSVEAVKEALDNVDTEIKDEAPEVENPELQTVPELQEKIAEVIEAKETLNEKLEANPEDAEKILKDELKKAKNLKKEALKLINKVKVNNPAFTSSWNGINYDF